MSREAARWEAGGSARLGQRGGFDPLRGLWALLSNVKFAVVLVGLAGVAGLIGSIVPQVPAPMRGNPAARAAWMALQEEDFGRFTGLMDRFDLFDIFHSAWFNGLWLTIILAVTVCTVSRFRPTWRSVQRPQRTVPDGYFERAHHRAAFTIPGDVTDVEALLRRRRYRVERVRSDGQATYLFAERFAWSQYATFVSHLALLMLLVGALLTVFVGFDRTLVIAETAAPAPVFTEPGPGQMFIGMQDSVRGVDADGNIIDYRSTIEVRRGDESKVCQTTVNDPCHAFGYKVHQAAFFDDLARLQILGPGGVPLFDNVVDFESRTTAVPAIRMAAPDGAVVFDGELAQMATDPGPSAGREDGVAIGFVELAAAGGPVTYALAWRILDGDMRLVAYGPDLPAVTVEPGGSVRSLGGAELSFVEPRAAPAIRIDDMPGARPGETVTLQLLKSSTGPYLFVTGIDDAADAGNLRLDPATPVSTSAGYTYTFGGQVEASGVSVRRDPGDTFIWLAVGMAMVGLGVTFYVPRRRLWVRVSEGRVTFAGLAERTTRLSRELRFMGASLGSRDALQPSDLAED